MMKKMASLAVMTAMITTLSFGTFATEVTTDSTAAPIPATVVTTPTEQPTVTAPAPTTAPADEQQKGSVHKGKQMNPAKQQRLQQQQLLLQQQKLRQQQIEKLRAQKLKLQQQQQQQLQQQQTQQQAVQQPVTTQSALGLDEPVVEFDLTGTTSPTVETPLDEVQNLDTTNVDQKDKQALKKMEGQLKGLNDFKIVPVENIVSVTGTFKANAPLIIEDKTVLMPLAVIEKAFGTKIQYIKSEKKFVLQKGKVLIEIFANKKVAEVNGKPVKVDAKPIMINNRVLLPTNIIAKSLELKVKYDAKTNTLNVMPKADAAASTVPAEGEKAPVTGQETTPEVIPTPVPTPIVPETTVTPIAPQN